jgi:hypothetical protein
MAMIALAVIIVVIVVAAGVGSYVYYASVATKSTTTTNASTSATTSGSQSSTSATSSGSSSTSSGSTASSTSLQLVGNIGDVVGNFTQMKIGINASYASGTTNATLSFTVVGTGTNSSNSVKLTWVNYTFSGLVNQTKPESYSYIVYYNSSWDPVVITFGGFNITSSTEVQAEAEIATLFYGILFNYQSSFVNSTVLSQLTKGTTTMQTFGAVTMNVTPYTASTLTEAGSSVTDFEADIGSIPSTSFSMVTHLEGSFSGGTQGSGSFSFKLISATQAS